MSNLPENPAGAGSAGPAPVEAPGSTIQPGHYYGRGIPYLPLDDYPGKLIAIEGTDGVGPAAS
jgi:hypothetical protein